MTIYGFVFSATEVEALREMSGFDKYPMEDFAAAVNQLEMANDADKKVTPEMRQAFAVRLKSYMKHWPVIKNAGENNRKHFQRLMHTFLPIKRVSRLILPDSAN